MRSIKILLIAIFILILGALGRILILDGYNEVIDGVSLYLIIFSIILAIIGCFISVDK